MKEKQRTPKRNQSDKNSRNSGRILLGAMLLILVVLGVRFSYVAITKQVKGHKLDQAAQQIYRSQNEIQAKRGEIFDAVGNVLAENTTTYTVAAVLDTQQKAPNGKPLYIAKSQDEQVGRKLAAVLGGKPNDYVKALRQGRHNKLNQIQFGQRGAKLDIQTYQKVKALKIAGITFNTGISRFYPNGVFASNLIGLTSLKTNDKTGQQSLTGIMGIEQAFNKKLQGRNGMKTTTIDNQDLAAAQQNLAVKNGYDIYTTINTKLQTTLEKKMQVLFDDMKPKSALAVVLDTKNGNIVASTQRPSFDASTGKGIGDFWTNELSEATFEPGSVMKGITLAAALDTGNWDPNATYQSGTLKIGDREVTDWNGGVGWGISTYSRGIAESSNVAMALTEQKMGAGVWHKYINRFKFLKSTNSGLANEAAGTMQFKYPIEQANTAFGQAISVTPLQMLQAYTAIAGNGEEIKPHIIEKIVDPNNKKVIYQAKREVVGQPIKQSTAKAARKQLEEVIYSPHGLGPMYALPGVRTTGKSGTAQIATATGYSTPGDNTNEIHSWMGMAPAKNPRYMMYIITKQPQQNTENISNDMADVFKAVMKQALQMSATDNKMAISADQQVDIPTLEQGSSKEAEREVTAANLVPVVMGDGNTVVSQSPSSGEKSIVGQRIFLNTGKDIAVPNMGGWSKSDVLTWAKLADIQVTIKGNGFVTTQSILPDTKLSDGYHDITVEFKEPK